MGYPFSCSFSYTNAFYDTFAPGIFGEMGLHPTKLEEKARSAVIPTIDHSNTSRSRRNEQSIPPPMKNERPKPNNPTEMRAIPARTQSTQTIFGTGE